MTYLKLLELILGIIGSGIVVRIVAYEITKPRGG